MVVAGGGQAEDERLTSCFRVCIPIPKMYAVL